MNLGLYILKFVYLKEPQLIDETIFGIGIFVRMELRYRE